MSLVPSASRTCPVGSSNARPHTTASDRAQRASRPRPVNNSPETRADRAAAGGWYSVAPIRAAARLINRLRPAEILVNRASQRSVRQGVRKSERTFFARSVAVRAIFRRGSSECAFRWSQHPLAHTWCQCAGRNRRHPKRIAAIKLEPDPATPTECSHSRWC